MSSETQQQMIAGVFKDTIIPLLAPSAWPFPDQIESAPKELKPTNLVDYASPLQPIVPAVIKVYKPDRSAPKLLTDLPDGPHFINKDYLRTATKDRREATPDGLDQHAPGAKVDAGKQQAWLCFRDFSKALGRVADVTTVGANKYTRGGWLHVRDGEDRYMEAFARHMLDYAEGKVWDDEEGGTNCLHLSQMIWNLLAVLELQERRNAND